jgi:hypothetical protein
MFFRPIRGGGRHFDEPNGPQTPCKQPALQRTEPKQYARDLLIVKGKLARLERFELPTRCLEGSCSIHLSYRRVRSSIPIVPEDWHPSPFGVIL